jgi:hypothetical protein
MRPLLISEKWHPTNTVEVRRVEHATNHFDGVVAGVNGATSRLVGADTGLVMV